VALVFVISEQYIDILLMLLLLMWCQVVNCS